jgi:hypothetical protein
MYVFPAEAMEEVVTSPVGGYDPRVNSSDDLLSLLDVCVCV